MILFTLRSTAEQTFDSREESRSSDVQVIQHPILCMKFVRRFERNAHNYYQPQNKALKSVESAHSKSTSDSHWHSRNLVNLTEATVRMAAIHHFTSPVLRLTSQHCEFVAPFFSYFLDNFRFTLSVISDIFAKKFQVKRIFMMYTRSIIVKAFQIP